ncbi:MAG: aldehyde dehydrogenase family protein [Elusimicrobia bacterium]|nr:aldehyde dehydrogenase family protein [Elusimicrobiota bacterium]
MPVTSVPPPARNMTSEEIARAVRGAREAGARWRRYPLAERVGLVRQVWDAVYARRAELVKVVHSETCKPLVEFEAMELCAAGLIVKYFTANAGRVLRDQAAWKPWVMLNKRAYVRYVPRGVVGLITPWNFPFLIPFGDAVPALIAGNAVVVKPSEWTTRTMLWVADVVNGTGLLPEGLLTVATGDGAAGRQVAESADMVLFTGSTRTGRMVAQAAAAGLKPAVLELGGKHPMIVFDDAALGRTAKAAVWGAFANCGQVCVGVERAYVEEGIHDRFVAAVTAGMAGLRQGLGGTGVDVGRLIFPPQFATVMDHLEDARSKGATVVGGDVVDAENLMIRPALVLGARPEMKVMSEETFGPVLPVMKVARGEDAIALSNEGPLGLAASLWTTDLDRAERLVETVEAGMVGVNELLSHYAVVSLPFGGIKSSGLGRRHSDSGLRMFCSPQSVLVHEWPSGVGDPWWFPYEDYKSKLVEWILKVV